MPALSVTDVAVGDDEPHTPTSTIIRLPATTLASIVAAWLVLLTARAVFCCTNVGATEVVGVTAFDGADGGEVPTVLVAVTVNVYVVPSARPLTSAVVAGGLPDTMVGAWATAPTNGVTV